MVITSPQVTGVQRIEVLQVGPDATTVLYTVVLSNAGPTATPDNLGPELITFLPPCAQIVPGSATANNGTVTVVDGQVLLWSGSVAPDGDNPRTTVSATVLVPNSGGGIGDRRRAAGTPVPNVTWWQSIILSDNDRSGDNETLSLTGTAPGNVEPSRLVVSATPATIPTLSTAGGTALGLLLAGAALWLLRRRGTPRGAD